MGEEKPGPGISHCGTCCTGSVSHVHHPRVGAGCDCESGAQFWEIWDGQAQPIRQRVSTLEHSKSKSVAEKECNHVDKSVFNHIILRI